MSDQPTDRPDPLVLAEQYGGVANVPNKVLVAHGYRRIVSWLDGSSRIEDIEEIEKGPGRARWLQKTYRGYVFADDWTALNAMAAGKHLVPKRDRVHMRQRAEAFKDAGIPPIFDPCIECGFPWVDCLIAWSTGSMGASVRMRASTEGIDFTRPGRVTPISIAEVRAFRSLAFMDDGTIDPPLVEEAILYLQESFVFRNDETRDHCLAQARRVFAHLEVALHTLPHEPRRFLADPLCHVEFVRERRWYLKVAPALREEMARRYLDTPRDGSYHKIKSRLRLLFPNVVDAHDAEQTAAREAALEAAVGQAIASQDVSPLPVEAFRSHPRAEELCALWVVNYRQRLAVEASRKGAVWCLRSMEIGKTATPAMQEIIGFARVAEAFDQFRLTLLQSLSDAEFMAVFKRYTRGKSHVSLTSVGLRGEHGSNASEALRAYIVGRMDQLRAKD